MIAHIGEPKSTHRSLISAVEDLRSDAQELGVEHQVVEMIFHANVGSIEDAVRLADAVRNRTGEVRDAFRMLSHYGAIVDVYRIGDRFSDAIVVAKDAIRASREQHSEHFEFSALSRLATVLLETGQFEEGSRIYDQLRKMERRVDEPMLRLGLDAFGARLATMAGHFDEARVLARRHHDGLGAATYATVAWRRISTTLLAEVHLRSDPSPLESGIFEELICVHDATKHLPLHDRTAGVLFVAHERAQDEAAASRMRAEYIAGHRRSVSSWESSMSRLGLAQLSASICDSP
jgi:hypothetical protein